MVYYLENNTDNKQIITNINKDSTKKYFFNIDNYNNIIDSIYSYPQGCHTTSYIYGTDNYILVVFKNNKYRIYIFMNPNYVKEFPNNKNIFYYFDKFKRSLLFEKRTLLPFYNK